MLYQYVCLRLWGLMRQTERKACRRKYSPISIFPGCMVNSHTTVIKSIFDGALSVLGIGYMKFNCWIWNCWYSSPAFLVY